MGTEDRGAGTVAPHRVFKPITLKDKKVTLAHSKARESGVQKARDTCVGKHIDIIVLFNSIFMW